MKTLPVGIQLYSVRDDVNADFRGTLRKIKEMGYDFVELFDLHGMTPVEMKATLNEVGLPALSAHVPYTDLVADPVGTLQKYIEVGCKYVAFPYLTEDCRPNTPAFPTTLENLHRVSRIGHDIGLTMLYHNHDFEFYVMPDGHFGLDYIYEEIPADLLQTELDVCWVKVAGQDPVTYIRKYAGRCPVVHLKDYYKEGSPSDMYELIGIKQEKKEKSTGLFEFRPLGLGMQDMPAILNAVVESGTEYVIVEQDSSTGCTPMEAIDISRRYLKSLGW